MPAGVCFAGRGAAPSRVSREACAEASNWWWGPGRAADEQARIWFRREDGEWEEWFVVKTSPALAAAGVALANGLFAARRFRNLHKIMYYTGEQVGVDNTAEGLARKDRAVRFSEGGRYIIHIGHAYIDGFTVNKGGGNPAYLMNDLGSALNNVRMDTAGAVIVGLVGGEDYRPCTVNAGDELAWDYGVEYWKDWGGKRVGRKTSTGAGGASRSTGKRSRDTVAAAATTTTTTTTTTTPTTSATPGSGTRSSTSTSSSTGGGGGGGDGGGASAWERAAEARRDERQRAATRRRVGGWAGDERGIT